MTLPQSAPAIVRPSNPYNPDYSPGKYVAFEAAVSAYIESSRNLFIDGDRTKAHMGNALLARPFWLGYLAVIPGYDLKKFPPPTDGTTMASVIFRAGQAVAQQVASGQTL